MRAHSAIAATLVALAVLNAVQIASAEDFVVAGESQVINGTELDDSFKVTGNYHEINSLGGADDFTVSGDFIYIEAGDGDDRFLSIQGFGAVIDAGEGNNTIDVSGSDHIIDAGGGNDTVENLFGSGHEVDLGNGNNTFSNVAGFAHGLYGGEGDDFFDDIYVDNAVIDAGDGNNTFVRLFAAYSEVNAGDGDDDFQQLIGDNSEINAGGGANRIRQTDALFQTIVSGAGNDRFGQIIGVGNDIRSGSGNDVFEDISGDYHEIFAGGGKDMLTITDGAHEVHGEGGNDVIVERSASTQILLSGGEGVDVLVLCSGDTEESIDTFEIVVTVVCDDSPAGKSVTVDPDSGFITIDGTAEPITVENLGAPADSFSVRICSTMGPTTAEDLTNVDERAVVDTCGGSGMGDPHFVGFDGHPYDYTGRPGTTFNVLSTLDTIVNAILAPDLVNGLTYMSTIGLRTRDTQCRVAVLEGRLVVHVNEVEVTEPAVQLPGGVEVVQDAATGDVTISSPELVITVALHGEHFLDLTSVHLSGGGAPDIIHGVLGQTAVAARGIQGYEGREEDYIVSSLWVDDFKYGHVFKGSTSPSAPLRMNRKMGELVGLVDAFAGRYD